MKMKDKLRPKAPPKPPPAVRVETPKVVVDMDAPQLNMDMPQLERILAAQAAQFTQMLGQAASAQNAAMQQILENQRAMLAALKDMNVTVDLPEQRKAYSIEIERDENGVAESMHIVADTPMSH